MNALMHPVARNLLQAADSASPRMLETIGMLDTPSI